MTIKEALEKQNYIRVDFIWVNRCNVCKKHYEQEDEEYSFEAMPKPSRNISHITKVHLIGMTRSSL